jgi:lysophospholipase L1-like esterase
VLCGDGKAKRRCRTHLLSVRRANIERPVRDSRRIRDAATLRRDTIGDVSGAAWTRYVALGDSLTEQIDADGDADCAVVPAIDSDPAGWADRLATILAGHSRLGGRKIGFVNLAQPSASIAYTVERQIPAAIALDADLVSVVVGAGELLTADADPASLASGLADGVAILRAAGAQVLLSNCFDPESAYLTKQARGKAALFTSYIWGIARESGVSVLDLWGIREFHDAALWAPDHSHLSALGHRLLAARGAHALGIPYAETSARIAPAPGVPPAAQRSVDFDHVYFLGSAGLDRLRNDRTRPRS